MQYLKQNVRERILEAAEQEFDQNGFQDASMRTIADSAGVSLGNVYRYFTNKQALFCAVAEPIIDEIGLKIDILFATSNDLSEAADGMADYFYQNPDKLTVVRQCVNSDIGALRDMVTEMAAKAVKSCFDGCFGLRQKVKNPDFDKAVANSFIFALASLSHCKNQKETKKQYGRELVAFFFEKIDQRFV